MPDALIQITLGLHQEPASVIDRCLRASEPGEGRLAVKLLADELAAMATGVRDGKVIARVDSVTRGAASQTIAMTQASSTAGDKIHIGIPGRPRRTLLAVAGTPVAANGEYAIITSDDATGISLAAAINAMPGLEEHLTAANASGTVTVTAVELGTWAHAIALVKEVTTGAAVTLGGAVLAGGDDVLTQPTITVTFGTPDIVAEDTIAVGSRKYTWKASASTATQITLSTTEATAAENFTAAINADAVWTGLISAARVGAVVTLTWLGDPRAGQHIVMDFSEANAGSVVLGGTVIVGTGESFTLGTSATGSSTTRTYGGKGAA